MREYLLSVIGMALIAGVISVIVPTGFGEGLKKYVGLIGSLCVLCILISPATDLLNFIAEFADGGYTDWFEEAESEFDGRYTDFLLAVGKDNIEGGIIVLLGENFKIPEDECSVSAQVFEEGEELRVEHVNIILSGKSVFRDPYAIEKYISELLGCECTVKSS